MRPATQRPRGFTLIELLVVIGIIALLISILVPTAMYIKEQGYKVRTTAHVNNIRSAVEAYYGTFQSYPGPLSDQDMYNGVKPTNVTVGSAVTGTENLVLGLLGGLRVAGGQVTYDSTLVGTGPNAFIRPAGTVLAGKSYSPFIEASTGTISPNDGKQCPFPGTDGSGASHFNDTNIPEFVDNYPEAMPVLYIRARQGASGVCSEANPAAQYDLRAIKPYTTTNYNAATNKRGLLTAGSYAAGGVAANNGPYNGVTYLADPQSNFVNNAPSSPRAKDSFIIIAAGADRLYGTPDDITTFGAVQP